MFSVTQRIKNITQPRGGYVPKDLFYERQYSDSFAVRDIETAFSSIQGTVTDYLTRYLISRNKYSAFDISINGAKLVDEVYNNHDEYNRIISLLDKVSGLDDTSIYNACKIAGYDTVLRNGVKSYRDIERLTIPEHVISNIRIMTTRSVEFLRAHGPVIRDGFTFDGGYTDLISSGDGDYLTRDILIDLKVSKFRFLPQWSLQLLIYYLLGLHSDHKEFQDICKLCMFNPYENISYTCCVEDISDETKYAVSRDVIGYKMLYSDDSKWNEVNGSDPNILEKVLNDNKSTGFDIDNYSDGIHEISINDYWTYLRSLDAQYSFRPKLNRTEAVIMIKHNGFHLFLSRSKKGVLCILSGGSLRKADYSPEYYYDNIERYAYSVIRRFGKYWDALYSISDRLKAATPNKESLRESQYSAYVKERESSHIKPMSFDDWYMYYRRNTDFSGRVHGCIVDIDFLNHIYLNPYDGTLIPYSAVSMYDKDVYKNTISLIAAKRPEKLDAFKQSCISDSSVTSLPGMARNAVPALVDPTDVVDLDFVKVYSHDMYDISRRIKSLQSIYDYKLIQTWYNEVLKENNCNLDERYLLPPAMKKRNANAEAQLIGKKAEQEGNHLAKITAYRSPNDIDIVFEDGVIQKNVKMRRWKEGKLIHPDVQQYTEKKQRERVSGNYSHKNKYIGMTRPMKCGLNATVIEYINGKDITIRFEDGTIREHVRTDKFKNGSVAYKKKN